ncbi:MAG: ABC transporter permease [Bacilli bacterium]|nr:ABC transporter permease [Bacilli bacterium]
MNSLLIILKKELKEVFRDKKSLSMMLIIPFMIPLIIIGMSALFNIETNKNINAYNNIGFNYELSSEEQKIAKDLNINVTYKTEKELKQDYDDGFINLYVTKNENTYILNGKTGDNTSYAIELVNTYFSKYKEYLQDKYLTDSNIDPDDVINIITVEENIKEKDNYFQNYILTYGFLFIIMAITVSSTYPATDATAGEKERGTLETLITFPIKSKDIILGKFLSVFISNLITGLLSFILYYISLIISGNTFKIYEGISLVLPAKTIIFILIVIVLYSLLIAGVCISVASKCKTFKEAQSALTPFTFLSLFPGMLAFMINIKSSLVLSMVPCLNFVLLFEDLMDGSLNVLYLVIMIASTIILIGVLLSVIIKQYKSEKIII